MIAFLLLSCCSQNLLFQMPSLGLSPRKKQVCHIASLEYHINEERKIISRTSFITKEKLNIAASKNLIA
jgi:hypothetical protein